MYRKYGYDITQACAVIRLRLESAADKSTDYIISDQLLISMITPFFAEAIWGISRDLPEYTVDDYYDECIDITKMSWDEMISAIITETSRQVDHIAIHLRSILPEFIYSPQSVKSISVDMSGMIYLEILESPWCESVSSTSFK